MVNSDILIAPYNSQDEANDALHEMAETLSRAGMAERHGVYVKRTRGVWAVWVHERNDDEVEHP